MLDKHQTPATLYFHQHNAGPSAFFEARTTIARYLQASVLIRVWGIFARVGVSRDIIEETTCQIEVGTRLFEGFEACHYDSTTAHERWSEQRHGEPG